MPSASLIMAELEKQPERYGVKVGSTVQTWRQIKVGVLGRYCVDTGLACLQFHGACPRARRDLLQQWHVSSARPRPRTRTHRHEAWAQGTGNINDRDLEYNDCQPSEWLPDHDRFDFWVAEKNTEQIGHSNHQSPQVDLNLSMQRMAGRVESELQPTSSGASDYRRRNKGSSFQSGHILVRQNIRITQEGGHASSRCPARVLEL